MSNTSPAPEPFWHVVVSKRAPTLDRAIRRADAAEDYAQKCRDGYDYAIDLDVKPLYTAEQMRAEFLAGYEAAEADAKVCQAPPPGWRCTREAGHEGPCAAVEAPEDLEFVERGMARLRERSA